MSVEFVLWCKQYILTIALVLTSQLTVTHFALLWSEKADLSEVSGTSKIS